MIAALAWKEYHEQRAIWTVMACLTVLLSFAALPTLAQEKPDFTSILLMGSLIVAPTYGLVCGSMLLAGEREAGTLTFLDSLTGRRTQVWTTKLVTGTALTLGQVAVFSVLLLQVLDRRKVPGPDLEPLVLVVACWTLEAFACGLFFSAVFRNALSAASLAALTVGLVWFVSVVPGLLSFRFSENLLLGAHVVLTAVALLGSWRIFCHPDFNRDSGVVADLSWMALLGPLSPTSQTLLLVLGVAGFFLGLFMPLTCLASWPFLTLLVGATCGLGVFTGRAGTFRPLRGGRRRRSALLWALTSTCWFTLSVSAMLLVFTGMALHLGIAETLDPAGRLRPGVDQDSFFLLMFRVFGRRPSSPSTPFFGHALLSPVTVLFLAYGFGIAQVLMLALKDATAVIVTVLLTLVVGGLCLPGLVSTWSGLWLLLAVPALLLTLWRAALNDEREHVVRLRLRCEGSMPNTAVLGTVLQESRTGSQWQALILNPDREALERLRSAEGISDFEEAPLVFEEAFHALLGRKEGAG